MSEISKRQGDPDDYDPRRDRQWHGAPRREDFADSLSVGWGDKALALRGSVVVIVVLLGLLGGIAFYFHDQQQREHSRQLRAVNMSLCVSLYDFQERKALRTAWQSDPKAPRYWCPNLAGDGGQ